MLEYRTGHILASRICLQPQSFFFLSHANKATHPMSRVLSTASFATNSQNGVRARYGKLLVPYSRRWRSSANLGKEAARPVESPASSKRLGLYIVATGLFTFMTGYFVHSIQKPKVDYSRIAEFPAPCYATMNEMEKAIGEIRRAISPEAVSTDDDDLKLHGFSEWAPNNIDTLPVAVAYPKSTTDVSTIAKICNEYRIPLIAYSGGSSIEGNFCAPHGGISIDFAHMNQIVKLNADDMDVVVQPSVPWMTLNEEIAHTGLFFPVDPSPTAQIGGMVGTNCSGTNAARYGTMKDWIVNLTVVLADGTVIKTRNRPRKSAAGYNLNGIFTGSEGTLGLVTEITLKLAVIPKESSVAVVSFPTIRDVAATASAVMRAGIPVAAMELLDDNAMSVLNRTGSTGIRKWAAKPTLFFKFSGSKASIADNVHEVQQISLANRGGAFEFASDEAEQHALWSGRKMALWSFLSLRPEGTELYSTDVAVPFSRVAEIVEVSKAEMDKLGLYSMVVGHLGDGNFHEAIMYNKSNPSEVAMVKGHVQDMINRALEMEGTCTGEHAIGLFKKESLLQEVGLDTLGVMRSIKKALDPNWILNPGKIFDTPV